MIDTNYITENLSYVYTVHLRMNYNKTTLYYHCKLTRTIVYFHYTWHLQGQDIQDWNLNVDFQCEPRERNRIYHLEVLQRCPKFFLYSIVRISIHNVHSMFVQNIPYAL